MATVSQSRFGQSGLYVPVVGLGVLLALIPLTAAHPQAGLASGLEECAALSSDAERLACYDRLQRDTQQAAVGSSDMVQADGAAAPVETTTAAKQIDSDSGAEQTAEPAAEPPRRPFWRRLRDRVARRAVETTDSSDSPAEAVAPIARPDEEAAVDEAVSDDGIEVTVVDIRRNLSGLAIFSTEKNGTWVQTSTRDRAYPDTPFSARIAGGLMGGRFLTPESGGIAIRVRGPD